jgi:hypothetical protein
MYHLKAKGLMDISLAVRILQQLRLFDAHLRVSASEKCNKIRITHKQFKRNAYFSQ